MSGGGKGGGDTTTVQKSDPWSGQQPYLTYGFDQAKQLYQGGGPQFYPNATYVPFSGQTEQALGRMENRSLGSAPEQGLNQYLTGSLQGNWLNSNPYLDAMYGNAAGKLTESFNEGVLPGLNATFGGAGRTGGGAHGLAAGRAAGELGDALGGLSANIYGGNYANERGLMQQAAGMVPMSSALDWNNIAQLGRVGGAVEGKAGEVLGDSMNRFNFGQQAPQEALARYIAAIQGNYGGTTTQDQEGQGGGGVAGAVGGGLLGYGLGNSLPMIGSALGIPMGAAPWLGALGGAVLGGLF